MFNNNFFHLALGFAFMVAASLALVFGVGVYESEMRDVSDTASVFEQQKSVENQKDIFLNRTIKTEKEWPPKLE
jgi:hypothetical protein